MADAQALGAIQEILPLEAHVANAGLCSDLEEIDGVPRGTQYVWYARPFDLGYELCLRENLIRDVADLEEYQVMPAWSLAELREMLKGQHFARVDDDDGERDASSVFCIAERLIGGGWQHVAYVLDDLREGPRHPQVAETDVDAHAMMYIYLKRNNLFREQP